MDNNEILELNKKEVVLKEQLAYVNGTVEQYQKQLREYKESHKEEFKDKKAEIKDIHTIGSIKALKIELEKRNKLQEEINQIINLKNKEKVKTQQELDYINNTIEQYKNQLREYKESHKEEFKDKKTEIKDIHAIGSIKALRIELEKRDKLQRKMELLDSKENEKVDEKSDKEETSRNKGNRKSGKEESQTEKKQTEQKENEKNDKEKYRLEDIDAMLNPDNSNKKNKSRVVNSNVIDELEQRAKEALDNDFEEIDLNGENKDELTKNNESIKILYNAKYNMYLIENTSTGEITTTRRNGKLLLNKEGMEEKYGKQVNTENVDVNILYALVEYDKKYMTNKAKEYYKIMTGRKEDKEYEMEKNQIEIEYNLKGLFDKEAFTEEEKNEILNIANNAKKKKIATVKKGAKVTVMELINKIKNKATKLLDFKKVEKLPVSKQSEQEKEEDDVKTQEIEEETSRNYQFAEEIRKKAREDKNKNNMKIMENKREASRMLKERAERLKNAKFEYKDNNYVATQREDDAR